MSGELASGWARTTLGRIRGDKLSGLDPAEFANEPFELYSVPAHAAGCPELVHGKSVGSAKQLVQPGCVLLCKINPRINRAWVVAESSAMRQIASTEWIAFPRTEGINPRFLRYFLGREEVRKHLATNVSGVGGSLMRVRPAVVDAIAMAVAPFREQERIVAKLDELYSDLDAGVAALLRARENLKRYRAAVLKAAVEGRLTADWRAQNPPSETGAELLARLLRERRLRWEQAKLAKFEASGRAPAHGWRSKYVEPLAPDTTRLPVLPAGWCWATIGQCFRVCVGATPSRAEASYWGGHIPWVSSGEVSFRDIQATKERITAAGLENSSTQLNPVGSVLLGMIGEGKTRGQAAILRIPACNNQNCAAIRVSETDVLPEFVFAWLSSCYDATRAIGSGNNQPALNKSLVESMAFPLPPLREQRFIVDCLDESLLAALHAADDTAVALKRGASLRQAILKLAFSGRLVPQDPNDEPASVLLERVRAARADAPAKSRVARNSQPSVAVAKEGPGSMARRKRGRPRRVAD